LDQTDGSITFFFYAQLDILSFPIKCFVNIYLSIVTYILYIQVLPIMAFNQKTRFLYRQVIEKICSMERNEYNLVEHTRSNFSL
jgi:hypothetical protein